MGFVDLGQYHQYTLAYSFIGANSLHFVQTGNSNLESLGGEDYPSKSTIFDSGNFQHNVHDHAPPKRPKSCKAGRSICSLFLLQNATNIAYRGILEVEINNRLLTRTQYA